MHTMRFPSDTSRHALARVGLVLAFALLGACGGDSSTEPPRPGSRGSEPVAIGIERGDDDESAAALLARKADAAHDDWNSEILGDACAQQLAELAHRIETGEALDAAALGELAVEQAVAAPLRPDELGTVFDDGTFEVRRWSPDAAAAALPLADALARLAAPLAGGIEPHAKFKPYRIDVGSGEWTTRVLYEASNRWADRGLQQAATWNCTWQPAAGEDAAPRLVRVELEAYEEVHTRAPEGRLFADCTVSALGHLPAYRNLLLPGTNHWLARLSRALYGITGHHGVALGDVDGDGLDDVLVCESGSLPNQLYLHRPDGTLEDGSREAGLDWLDSTAAALLIDLDNDGDQDLVAATIPDLVVASNDGRGRFEVRSKHPISRGAKSLCAADYDEDGDLDVYVCSYASASESDGVGAYPYHDANNGEPNLLLRNEGDLSFSDVTDSVGLDQNNARFSFAAAWDDFDGDGDLDLYVANDFGRNNLYRNEGGRFTDVAASAGVEDIASGMSVAWGDYDRNGWTDVYVANMFSSAGGRVAYQRRFAEGRSAETLANVQRMARGNTLFANRGDGRFDDVSEIANVTLGRWAWSSKFADLNNDGWQDLVIANGYLTMENSDDL